MSNSIEAIKKAINLIEIYGWNKDQVIGDKLSGFSLLGVIINCSSDAHIRFDVADRISSLFPGKSILELNSIFNSKKDMIEMLGLIQNQVCFQKTGNNN